MTDTPTSRRHRARRGDGELLREELLDAAESLLVEKGSVSAVSLRAVATRIGVTPPSIYLHFEDKDELFFEVCNRRFEEFEAVLLAARDEYPDDPVAACRACGEAYVSYALASPEHYHVLFGADPNDSLLDGRDVTDLPGTRALMALAELVADGIASGAFREADPFEVALSLWAMCHGVVHVLLHAEKPGLAPPDPQGFVDTALDTALLGLLPR